MLIYVVIIHYIVLKCIFFSLKLPKFLFFTLLYLRHLCFVVLFLVSVIFLDIENYEKGG